MAAVIDDKINGGSRQSSGMIAVAQQREIAEVQAAMMIARMNPRDEKLAKDRILQACTRPKLAEVALYQYNRGGSDVTGVSIRLAEVMAQNWGNFECGVRELDQRDGESTVEAYAWDIQTNFRDKKIFQVPHIRYSKAKGNVVLTDPRDIYEMIANLGARRKRACILAVIPGDVQEEAIKQSELTLTVKAEVTPERLKSLVEKFGEFGVTQEMIETRIQRHLEAMTPALLVQLGKIYNSIKDGMSTAAEWFTAKAEPEKGAISMDDLKPGKEENRGHGNEGLGAVAGKEPEKPAETKPASAESKPPVSETKTPETKKPTTEKPKGKGNSTYSDHEDNPFA